MADLPINYMPFLANQKGQYYLSTGNLPVGGTNLSFLPYLTDGRVDPQFLAQEYIKTTVAAMEAIPNPKTHDKCTVTNDPTAVNNGTYIYTGSSWIKYGGSGSITDVSVNGSTIVTQGIAAFSVTTSASNGIALTYNTGTKVIGLTASVGNAASYGTLKLVDAIGGGTLSTSGGTATTPKAVFDAIAAIPIPVKAVTMNGTAVTPASGTVALAVTASGGVSATTNASGNVSMTLDAAAAKTALGLKSAAYADTGAASGQIPVLDATGKLPISSIPSMAVTSVKRITDTDITDMAKLVAYINTQTGATGLGTDDLVVVDNGVASVVGNYGLSVAPPGVTEANLVKLYATNGTANSVLFNGKLYSSVDGVITITGQVVTSVTVAGAGASALTASQAQNTTAGTTVVTLSLASASTSAQGVVQLTSATGNSETLAATQKAVADSLASAKTYADGLNTTMGTRVTALETTTSGLVKTVTKGSGSSSGLAVSTASGNVIITVADSTTSVPGLVTMAPGAAGSVVYTKAQVDTAVAGATYTLPVATASVLGGVKQGTNITIAADGTISGAAPYTLPAATTSAQGGVILASAIDSTTNASRAVTGALATTALAQKAAKGTYPANITTFTTANIGATGTLAIANVKPILYIKLSNGFIVHPAITVDTTSQSVTLFSPGERDLVYGGAFTAANDANVHTIVYGEITI